MKKCGWKSYGSFWLHRIAVPVIVLVWLTVSQARAELRLIPREDSPDAIQAPSSLSVVAKPEAPSFMSIDVGDAIKSTPLQMFRNDLGTTIYAQQLSESEGTSASDSKAGNFGVGADAAATEGRQILTVPLSLEVDQVAMLCLDLPVVFSSRRKGENHWGIGDISAGIVYRFLDLYEDNLRVVYVLKLKLPTGSRSWDTGNGLTEWYTGLTFIGKAGRFLPQGGQDVRINSNDLFANTYGGLDYNPAISVKWLYVGGRLIWSTQVRNWGIGRENRTSGFLSIAPGVNILYARTFSAYFNVSVPVAGTKNARFRYWPVFNFGTTHVF